MLDVYVNRGVSRSQFKACVLGISPIFSACRNFVRVCKLEGIAQNVQTPIRLKRRSAGLIGKKCLALSLGLPGQLLNYVGYLVRP